jgi:hypothetical protein
MEISTTEKQKQAAKWFADRFIREAGGRDFVLLRNGWTAGELGLASNTIKYRIDRYPQYHILFSHDRDTDQIEVLPLHPEASWAFGIITPIEDEDTILEFYYRTNGEGQYES